MSNIVCFMLGNSNVTIKYINSQNAQTIFFNDIKNPINIIYEISLLPVNCLKAAIVCFYGENIEYKSEIAKHLEFYYSQHQIPVFCCSWNSIFISSTLLAAVNKHGYGVLDEKMDFIFCEENSVTKFHVIKCENKYLIYEIINGALNQIQIADNKKLFISCSHRNAPITNGQRYIKEKVLEHLMPKKVIEINKNIQHFCNNAIINKVMDSMGKILSKYDVLTTGFYEYGIGKSKLLSTIALGWPVREYQNFCAINVKMHDIIPFKKTIICYKAFKNLMFYKFGPHGPIKISEEFTIQSNSAVTLSINKFFQPHWEIKSCQNLIKSGVIITFNKTNFAVETIKDGNVQNVGLKNIPLMISFIDGRIQIGDEARKMKESHNSFVIKDLMKIIKGEIIISNKDFKINEEKNDEKFIKFDTFRGRRKATPSFLFAFFIKWTILKAEASLGVSLETIAIIPRHCDDKMLTHFKAACTKLKLKNAQIQKRRIIEIFNYICKEYEIFDY